MQITVFSTQVLQHPTEALLVPMLADAPLSAPLAAIDSALDGGVQAQVAEGHFSPRLKAVMVLPTFGRLLAFHLTVFGLGNAEQLRANAFGTAFAAAIHKAYDWGADEMALVWPLGWALSDADLVQATQKACHQEQQHLSALAVLLPEDHDPTALQQAFDKG